MPRSRLLLVDDHALFREGLTRLFSYQVDFEVVAEAENAAHAVERAQRLKPDLVLMDVDLPGEDGVSATRRIKGLCPDVAVVMLTAYDDTDGMLEALKAGARG